MSMTISSSSSTKANGPPTIASGETCPMQGPLVPPEKRPSVIKATELSRPIPTSAAVGDNISLIPGPPRGPSYLIIITDPLEIFLSMIAFIASSSLPNTFAEPLKTIISSASALCLITAPSGAIFP